MFSPSESSIKRRRTSSPTLPPCRDLVHEMPKHIFDADKWGLDSIKCVMVIFPIFEKILEGRNSDSYSEKDN